MSISNKCALLGSLAMHTIIALIWIFYSYRFYTAHPELNNSQTIEVRLYRQPEIAAASPIQQPESISLSSSSALSFSTAPSDARPKKDLTSPIHRKDLGHGFVLPPQEMPYLPAGKLDSRPYPKTPVVIPFPESSLSTEKASAVLILYVGANGLIDRVEIDQSELAPDFEKAAIDAFKHAVMEPATKDGKPVRSRMKVEVNFEAR